MPDPGVASAVVRFDAFAADLRAGELRKDGRRLKLQEQPFRVLSVLLERPGEVVTREELRQTLWPADTFVDFDHGLNSAVARLREALRDSADRPRYIETVAKRGYRFIAPLFYESAPPVSAPAPRPPALHETQSSSYVQVKAWVGALLLLGGLVGALTTWIFYRSRPDPPAALLDVVPLLGLRGFQATPAFSPDGTLVAFRENDGDRNTGIYTAVVGGEKSVQVTHDPGDCCPTWSPDGRQIAFSRYSDKLVSIYIVPALGGTERLLYRGTSSMGSGISWSPDGKFIAFSESSGADPTHATLSVVALADSSTHALSFPPPASVDQEPAFSPDGSQLAFVRSTVAGVSNDLYVMPATGGAAKRLTFDNRPIMGPPTWTSDSREVIFSSNRGAATGLWRIKASGGMLRPVAGPEGEAKWPSMSAKDGSLVYEQWVSKFNIWRLDLRDSRHYERPPSVLVSEKGDKMRPELSPDGKKIAFESNRLGYWDIWTCDIDGSNCDQVTALHGTAGRARWSPDGRYLAFEFHPNGRSEIYLVELPSGIPRLLPTIPGADNLSPSWSRDGKSLYFASKRGGDPFQIWRMPIRGGAPIQLTKSGGISAVESPDGRYLYYCKFEQGGIWRMPLQGGDETEVVSDIEGGGWADWGVTSDGIYFLQFRQFPHVAIDFFQFSTGKTIPIWTPEKEPGWGLSLSSDGKSLVYVQREFAESNIMLVKNFR